MNKHQRKTRSNSILRAVFVGLSLLFQIGWILLLVLKLNAHSVWISGATGILALLAVLKLYSKDTTSAMKMPWVMLILVFPVMGLSLYLMIEVFGDLGRTGKRIEDARNRMAPCLAQPGGVLDSLPQPLKNQHRYLWEQTGSPAWKNTDLQFYPEAVDAFAALKEALEQAEQFIFMEYFIVAEGSAFSEIREILARKARQGVDVRLMYDDLGSIGYTNFSFARELNREGIRCRIVNPALPVLNLFMNHRDHRKITAVDGKVAFTGGYNLADEYFDRTRPYGKWKDTGLRLEGQGVQSLTAFFLQMWCAVTRQEEDITRFLQPYSVPQGDGIVQPYGDTPLGRERVAENVFLNMISAAQESLYFTTPYLIITDEMVRALGLAAKRGVDVRIVTPGIPDKKMVYRVTRSYYPVLAAQGVRIFEYSPGFLHAKQCVCDGKIASVGTSNLDYRSLYLHFENNVLFSGCEAVDQVAADFAHLFAVSREVTDRYRAGPNAMLRLWQCILRLFAPLM